MTTPAIINRSIAAMQDQFERKRLSWPGLHARIETTGLDSLDKVEMAHDLEEQLCITLRDDPWEDAETLADWQILIQAALVEAEQVDT